LTIKLTQHVPIEKIETQKISGSKGLAAFSRISLGAVREILVLNATKTLHIARRANSPFHKLLCSSRICS